MTPLHAQATAPAGLLSPDTIRETLERGLAGRFAGQRVLVLIPDHTRSMPLPFLFRAVVDVLHDAAKLDFMVALGTHPPLSRESMHRLVGISEEERTSRFASIGLFNHAWNDPTALATLGVMEGDEIRELAGSHWHSSLPSQVQIRLNRAALEHDHILILGPPFRTRWWVFPAVRSTCFPASPAAR